MTAEPPAHEGFLTTEEVLEYLQVNLRAVYRLIKSNAIPAVRVGRQWRFKKQDIDAWLEGRKGPTRRAQSGRRRLLLVDDDEGTRILLTKMGYLTKPLRDTQVLEAAARALGAPAA